MTDAPTFPVTVRGRKVAVVYEHAHGYHVFRTQGHDVSVSGLGKADAWKRFLARLDELHR